LEATVAKLCSEKSELEKQVVEMRSRADQIERRSNEQKSAEEKKHAEEIQYLKKTNQQLKVFLYMPGIQCTNFLQSIKCSKVQVLGYNSNQ
jgi:hypothetical protein